MTPTQPTPRLYSRAEFDALRTDPRWALPERVEPGTACVILVGRGAESNSDAQPGGVVVLEELCGGDAARVLGDGKAARTVLKRVLRLAPPDYAGLAPEPQAAPDATAEVPPAQTETPTFREGQRVRVVGTTSSGAVHPDLPIGMECTVRHDGHVEDRAGFRWRTAGERNYRFELIPDTDTAPPPAQTQPQPDAPDRSPTPAERVLTVVRNLAVSHHGDAGRWARGVLEDADFRVEPQPAWRIVEPGS